MAGLRPSRRFPSPTCSSLTSPQLRFLKATATRTCSELVSMATRMQSKKYGVKWQPLPFVNEEGCNYYVGSAISSKVPSTMQYMCCETTVHATLDEVAEILSGDDQTTMGAEAVQKLDANILKSKHLLTLKRLDRLKICLKWFVWNSTSSYVPIRDFVVLQYQNDVHVRGRNGWAQSTHSVELPCIPSYASSHNLVRSSMYRSGYIVLETDDPNVVRVMHMIQVDFKGHVPQEDAVEMLRLRVGNIGILDAFFAKLTLVARIISNMETTLIGNLDTIKVCAMCSKKFGFLTKKIVCQICGDVVCSECSQTRDLQIPVPALKHVNVCNVCQVKERCSTSSEAENQRRANQRSFLRQMEPRHGNRASHRQSHRQRNNGSLLIDDDDNQDPYMQIMQGKQQQQSFLDNESPNNQPLYSFLEDSASGYDEEKHYRPKPNLISPFNSTSAVVGNGNYPSSYYHNFHLESSSKSYRKHDF
ncbi:hypothetical protein THRCLA_06515 [Thraustotheca clavata]|uniref:FYVE-type domain-containing protein n=1 Tax=Thraustotheca clavata TaxID=74557 RepID=A0A1V9ZN85_9STRA|nr:hypothetical protein THRCLA_06515 [Thraustotheca clavata]